MKAASRIMDTETCCKLAWIALWIIHEMSGAAHQVHITQQLNQMLDKLLLKAVQLHGQRWPEHRQMALQTSQAGQSSDGESSFFLPFCSSFHASTFCLL